MGVARLVGRSVEARRVFSWQFRAFLWQKEMIFLGTYRALQGNDFCRLSELDFRGQWWSEPGNARRRASCFAELCLYSQDVFQTITIKLSARLYTTADLPVEKKWKFLLKNFLTVFDGLNG